MFAGFGVPFRQNGAYGPKANSLSGRPAGLSHASSVAPKAINSPAKAPATGGGLSLCH